MGLRKKYVAPPSRLYAPLGGIFGTFWLDDVKKISFNREPVLIDLAHQPQYNLWRGHFAERFTTYKEPIMGDVTRAQQDPKPGKTSVTDLVMIDIVDRRAQGVEKYGMELKTDNGRDALVDAYQEALDLVMYLRQAIEERKEREVKRKEAIVSAQMKDVPLEQLDLFVGEISPIYRVSKVDPPLKGDYTRPGRFIPVREFIPTPDPHPTVDETILEEAQRLVHGNRGDDYGHPIFDMTRSADMLTALLRDKLRVGVRLEAEDIGQCMVAVKQSRHRNKPKRDNLTDTAGYAETLNMIKEWREANPGVDPRDRF
jgi:hypothetical protein